MAGESGGHYCDPLIAFMMVYNAIKGNYTDFAGKFEDVPFPYLYVSLSLIHIFAKTHRDKVFNRKSGGLLV